MSTDKRGFFTEEQYLQIWDMIFSQTGYPVGHPKNESALNEDTVVEDKGGIPLPKDLISTDNLHFVGADGIKKPLTDLYEKKYTQAQVDAIREETWKAARTWIDGNYSHKHFPQYRSECKYQSFQDYLNSLNTDNKPYTGKDSNAYQCYLKDCDCEGGGIILHEGKAVCRWCRKPYGKGAMINYLPEHFQPEKSDTGKGSKVDWEIVSFYCESYDTINRLSKDGTYGMFNAEQKDLLTSSLHKIHSVRRLRDNTVFSVGDEWDNCKIVFFKLMGNDIEVYFSNDVPSMDLMFLTPPKPTPPEKTVTDNSDVVCLSLNDISDSWDNHSVMPFKESVLYKSIKEKLNQKLKTHTP